LDHDVNFTWYTIAVVFLVVAYVAAILTLFLTLSP
jgi:hypothetical protein